MKPFSLNIRGCLKEFGHPVVMGIVNVTPDSFFAGSRVNAPAQISRRAERMAAEGADMVDIGACSTRPGAEIVGADEEWRRLEAGIAAVRRAVGTDIPVSVDTFRADVARRAVEAGADIINDISGGNLDSGMFAAVAELKVPYILMHMRGTPATMQTLTDYDGNIAACVARELSGPLRRLEEAGVADIIVDPGFGFAKTLRQNWELARDMESLEILNRPMLVGVSRKSMLVKLLNISADEALPATTALNFAMLERGAAILRVHDVAEARQATAMYAAISS
ncbi:MAG: dihydropteroate synthase [Muribaculaceae bacterium]|nr:dihydropteroate synthase [Muribaculaceae bacterium]